ncbi:hypothetical protein GJ496_008002 [Pomphorhynchus laevis]|nr:hypothetical protein GJ496_007998 [Pomphorhynchus laevis]KAI0978839.1 hypothetical protein GJ496_008002 [Pomphorhynchus laevis]
MNILTAPSCAQLFEVQLSAYLCHITQCYALMSEGPTSKHYEILNVTYSTNSGIIMLTDTWLSDPESINIAGYFYFHEIRSHEGGGYSLFIYATYMSKLSL